METEEANNIEKTEISKKTILYGKKKKKIPFITIVNYKTSLNNNCYLFITKPPYITIVNYKTYKHN